MKLSPIAVKKYTAHDVVKSFSKNGLRIFVEDLSSIFPELKVPEENNLNFSF